MRAAGCVINDVADRHIDKHVSRTKLRPLTSGEVSLNEAFGLITVLFIASLLVLICLPKDCFYIALIALFITVIYPFCKRFLNAPQLVLGLAFSMGIPMAYVASGTRLGGQFIFIFIINFTWIIAYDTMYAMTDKADDLRIGVKSTAIYFGSYDRLMIGILQSAVHVLWLCWALLNHANVGFYFLWFAAGCILLYQQILIRNQIPQKCFKAFIISIYYGGLMWIAISVGLH